MDKGSTVMEDLATRLLSLPESERSDFSKLFSHSEQAYKYYELQRHDSPDLPPYSLKAFIEMLFRHSPSLAQTSSGADLDLLIERWKSERRKLQPLIGAVIINPVLTKCLLVQSTYGNWEIPMTNLEVCEEEFGAAVENVREKTGLDISGFIRDGQFLEGTINGSRVKVFIAVLDFEMVPLQKQPVRWFTIKHLPHHYGDVAFQQITGVDPKNLLSVIPFVQSLWEWIARHQSDFRQGAFKDTPDPRVKGPKPVGIPPPPITPLRSASHSKTKAPPLSKSQPGSEGPTNAQPVTQESLQRQQHALTSIPYPPVLLPPPLQHTHTPALLPPPLQHTHTPALFPSPQQTPTHTPTLLPSPQRLAPAPYYPPGAMYPGGPQPRLQGLSQAPPVTHYGTPLPAYRGPVHGYSHTPSVPYCSRPLPAVQSYSGRMGVGQDSLAHTPLQLECSQALVGFRFKGSVLT